MQIKNLISSLLPSFGKARVLEDLRITESELKEFTIPAYTTSLPLFKTYNYKSEKVQDQFAQFGRLVKSVKTNPIVTIYDGFKEVLDNIQVMEKMIEKTYNEEVASSGLTYMKAQLLQLVEATAFFSKYARKYLIYVYVEETALVEGAEDQSGAMTQVEREWIESNFLNFCTVFGILTDNSSKVEQHLMEIPDIVITTENAETLPHTVGEKKLDPFSMKLIPIWMNPIYHIGMMVAEWQANRYKEAKEELKVLQLRKLNLERLQDGKPDAHLQKEIEYTESRIQKLQYEIHKLEADK